MPDQSIPSPHQSFRGPAQKNPGNLDEMAAKWSIPGMLMEPTATLSLYAGRLIDRQTGRAYSADELLEAGGVPDTLEPENLILADLSNTAAPANTLAYKGDALAKHDGTTVGGNLITQNRITGTLRCDCNGSSMTTGARFAVVRIPIPSTWMEDEAVLKILGEVKALFGTAFYVTEEPVTQIRMGFAFQGAQTQPSTHWYYWDAMTGSETLNLVTSHLGAGFSLASGAGGDLFLAHSTGSIISDRWGGAAGSTFSITVGNTTQGASVTGGDPTTATTLWLMVEIKADGTTFGASHVFDLHYDLAIDVTLP